MARVKVVLKQPVDKLGDAGETVQVSGGFARNYLIPRGLAVPATKGALKQAADWANSKGAKEVREKQSASALKAKLESASLQVTAQAGPDGRLFGSVTANEIVEAIKATHDVDIDRRAVQLPEPIRHLGVHTVKIPLHSEVGAEVTVEVAAAS